MAESTHHFMEMLSTHAVNLTAASAAGKLVVAYGRDKEVDDVLNALASPGELYPVVMGGPRSGKTTVVHHAINRITRGECPKTLRDAQVFEITPSRIINALGGSAQWSSHIGDFMAQLVDSGAILFLRDFHTALGLGISEDDSPQDLAYVLGDLLKGKHPRMIMEARSRPLEALFSEYSGYKNLFSGITVGEMDRVSAIPVIRKATEDLEVIHLVSIGADACDEAVELAARFQVNELLPGSAIDLLKDVLTTIDAGNAQILQRDRVRRRFIQRSGLPEFLVTDDAPYDEAAVRATLTRRVYGQEQAVDAILRMIALVRARLNNPLRPMGVFLFIGPTGVGKTELIKALSQFLFGGPDRIVRFNMADYAEDWQLSLLFGNPLRDNESLRKGQLSMRLNGQPFSVLLLDEFEKAHELVNQRFLQLFDEGILFNGAGEEINLRNTIIVLTSNLGAEQVGPTIGFRMRDPMLEAEHAVIRQSEKYFRPEFINRLDAVCFFKPLPRHVIRQIAQREVIEVISREGIVRQNLQISVDDAVLDLIVERGYDLRYGARYLKRQIERSITYPLARQIARKRLEPGAAVRLMVRNSDIQVGLLNLSESADGEALRSGQMAAAVDIPLPNLKDLRLALDQYEARVTLMFEQYRIDEQKARVEKMMERIGEPEFWQQPQEATAQMEILNQLTQRVDQAENVRQLLEQLKAALGNVRPARGKVAVLPNEVAPLYNELTRELPLTELMLCLRTEEDQSPAFVTVRQIGQLDDTPAAGEWVRTLIEMYTAWGMGRRFHVTLLNEAVTNGALSEVTLNIAGFGAYALLRGETGSHRLVRGQTGKKGDPRLSVWAHVDVEADLPPTPDMQKLVRCESHAVREAGIVTERITRSAVISQITGGQPTGRTFHWRNAIGQEELTQQAIRFLTAQLHRQDSDVKVVDADGVISLTDHVRVYTLYKQQQVRDARTGRTSNQPKKVLAGDLDDFLLAYLQMTTD